MKRITDVIRIIRIKLRGITDVIRIRDAIHRCNKDQRCNKGDRDDNFESNF